MKYEKYTVRASNSFLQYDFVSHGPKGHVNKRANYVEYFDYPGVYNLSFGDVRDGEADDLIFADNRDGAKVLATVSFTVFVFLDKYPGMSVLIKGRTMSRTRLYRMAITINFESLKYDIIILGQLNGQWYPFEPNCNYTAFMIKKRNT